MLPTLYAIAAIGSALAAVLAWVAKIKWSEDYRAANERIIIAQDAEISSLRTQLEMVERLASGKLLEWATSTKEGLETALAETESRLKTAEAHVQELRERKADVQFQVTANLDALIEEAARSAERLQAKVEAQRLQLRIRELDDAPERVASALRRVEQGEKEYQSIQATAESLRESWIRDRQDAETKTQAYRERATELQQHVQELKEQGPEAKCVMCERPLEDAHARVLAELEENFDSTVSDGRWWRSRAEQLQEEPTGLSETEQILVMIREDLDEEHSHLDLARKQSQELETIWREYEMVTMRLRELEARK